MDPVVAFFLRGNMMDGREILSSDEFQRCADFHGHLCPGLAIGYRAAKAGLERLGQDRAADDELVAVIETDACGVDAVQVLTGCTTGKGNLVIKDYGKHVITLMGRASGKGLRLSLKPGALSIDERHQALMGKITNGTATREEQQEFEELHLQRTCEVLEKPLEDLFYIAIPKGPLPSRARIEPSIACDRCGEPTMASKLIERNGKRLCRECMEG